MKTEIKSQKSEANEQSFVLQVSSIKYQPFYFLLLTLYMAFSSFTTDEYILQNSLPLTHAKFTTDHLGNAYVLVENQLLQFDSIGKPKANYADPTAGVLTSVDAANPLKILLFFRDFAQVHVLNNKLALESTIQLRNAGIEQPLLVCQSYLDGYWIFDQQDFSLKKLNLNLQLAYQSGNMNQTLGYSLQPESITEAGDFVYMNNPATGILIFDKYGSYYKTIPVTGVSALQIVGKDLLYVKNNKLMRYNFSTVNENEVILPAHDSLLNARFEQHQLFLLTTASLTFYSY